MGSSTSSSSLALPPLRWGLLLTLAVFLLCSYVALSEYLLRDRGFLATHRDSQNSWLKQRARASELGDKALILLGASRIQLGMDLPNLRQMTGLEPVMLAIDGSSFAPILAGLANDPSIRGTVVVDVMPGIISLQQSGGASDRYQAAYERGDGDSSLLASPFQRFDALLVEAIRGGLVNYADSARPWDSLSRRLLDPYSTPQYLQTLSDRSRLADYGKVDLPTLYLHRVKRHLGGGQSINENTAPAEGLGNLALFIQQLEPDSLDGQPAQELREFEKAVKAIQQRGGKVILMSMPTSGLVTEIDARRYPRYLYWDRMAAFTSAHVLHWQDYKELSSFFCPDGSHLDQRDRVPFTKAFVRLAGLERR